MKNGPIPAEINPDYSLHPGAILRMVLAERGLRQSELAERTGLTAKHINQLIKENIGISSDVAVLLEKALGVDAEYWINADLRHSLHVSRQRAEARLPEYTAWARSFDPFTVVKHGIVDKSDDDATKADKLLRFFNVATPEAFEDTWIRPRVSFRRSQSFTVAEHNTALWLRLVERSAEGVAVEAFRPGALRKAVRSLPRLTALPLVDGFLSARAVLADAGVVVTFVREVPGTRVCGATWWLAADRPVLAVTERHRKPDILWWTLLHECAHLVLHPRRTTFLDLDREIDEGDEAELEADAFALRTLLPDDAPELIASASSGDDLRRLAAKFGVGPGVVGGQYGHLTENWALAAPLRGKIKDEDVEAIESAVA